jgi:hypothetical protein
MSQLNASISWNEIRTHLNIKKKKAKKNVSETEKTRRGSISNNKLSSPRTSGQFSGPRTIKFPTDTTHHSQNPSLHQNEGPHANKEQHTRTVSLKSSFGGSLAGEKN